MLIGLIDRGKRKPSTFQVRTSNAIFSMGSRDWVMILYDLINKIHSMLCARPVIPINEV